MPSPIHTTLQRILAAPGAPSRGVAAFDADGTLWDGDVAEDFLLWMISEGHVSGTRWTVYDSTNRHDVPEACRELLRSFAGMALAELRGHVENFWQKSPERTWLPRVVAALREAKALGLTTCVVSASPTLVLEPLRRHVPVDHVLGLDAAVEGERLTGDVAGVPTFGPGKVTRAVSLGLPILLAAGNSELDVPLLRASEGVAWAVNPDQELAAAAEAAEDAGTPWLVTFEPVGGGL